MPWRSGHPNVPTSTAITISTARAGTASCLVMTTSSLRRPTRLGPRDTRDVFMSMFNHYSGYTELMSTLFNDADRPGRELPHCPATPREMWPRWIGEGWFDWEPDGWPFCPIITTSPRGGMFAIYRSVVRPLQRPHDRPRTRDAPHRGVLRFRRSTEC